MPSWKKVLISGSDAALNSLIVTNGITGSLFGTASWAISASRATTASFALTASYSQNLQISGSINNVDYIDFNTGSAIPAYKSGRVFWDNTDGALSVYNAEADITLQVGQENWVRVFNQTGVTITNGTPVRLVGAQGDVPKIVKAQSAQVSGSALGDNQIIGLATHDIETNSIGYVTTQGLTRGVNTSEFTDGDLLFVSSSAGVITNVIPQAPFEVIQVGICVKAGPGGSGIIFVFPTQPIDFGDLASAERGTYTYGDLWSYQQSGSVGIWRHTNQLSGSYSITGSLNVTAGITGSLFGTSSWALNAVTASYTNIGSLGGFIQGGNSFGATATLGTNDSQSLALETNNTTRMFISANGNIGVGTTNFATPSFGGSIPNFIIDNTEGPVVQLRKGSTTTTGQTLGAIEFVSQDSTAFKYLAGRIRATSYQGASGGASGGSHITFETGTGTTGATISEVMRIAATGNVGIGNTIPAEKLDVSGNILMGGGGPRTLTLEASGAGGTEIKLLPNTTGGFARINVGNTNQPLDFQMNSANVMRITQTGNIGINTTAPDTKLHIEDVTKVLTGNVAGVAQGTLSLVSTDAQAANVGPSLVFGGNFIDSSSTRIAYAGIAGRKANSSSVNADGYLSFLTWRSTGLTEAMRITPAGFVGIGTTIPGVRFVNAGGVASSGPTLGSGLVGSQALVSENSLYGMYSGVSNNGDVWHQVQRNDSNTAVYNILLQPAGGSVGIGTSAFSFSSKFEMRGSSAPQNSLFLTTQTFTASSAGSALRIGHEATSGNTSARIENLIGGGTAFGNLGLQVGGGSVGVGTSVPNAKLDVNGSLIISQSLLQYSNLASVTTGVTANVASFTTGSYTAAFFDYVTTSGVNARAGTVFTVWNGANVEYTDTSTNDIGSTTNLILSASLSAGSIRLQARSVSGTWSVKTLARMI